MKLSSAFAFHTLSNFLNITHITSCTFFHFGLRHAYAATITDNRNSVQTTNRNFQYRHYLLENPMYAMFGSMAYPLPVFDKMDKPRTAEDVQHVFDKTCKRDAAEDARHVFDETHKPNTFLCNTMLREYVQSGLLREAIEFYFQMQKADVVPDDFTYSFVLKACGGLSALQQGKEIHQDIVRRGYVSDVYVANALVAMYAKCGRLDFAHEVFDKMPVRDVVSWNSMIAGYAQNGHGIDALTLFSEMQWFGTRPTGITVVCVLQGCAELGALQHGKSIHACIVRGGFVSDVFVGNSLVVMYAKCGSIDVARQLFDEMSKRDVVSWNAMIAGYGQNGYADHALMLFHKMSLIGLKADAVSMVGVLQACAHLEDLQKGKLIHKHIIQSGFESNVFVKNSLISMYAKCSSIENACQIFDKMPERNVISWNAMIAGCVQSGHATEGLTLFHHMQMAEVSPDSVTMESLLQACGLLGALEEGKLIHNHIIKNGLVLDGFVGNSLLAMYARSGSLEFARQLFNKMTSKNLVAWNAMVAGCVQNGRAIEALILFQQMQVTDVRPDSITMVSMIQACALLATLEQGQCIHGYLIKSGFESSVFVGTSIIDMYAKHGNVELACQAFNIMSKKDAISWNAMIGGYSQNGHATESLKLFYQMQHANVTPDSGTMVSGLQACSQLGALEEGKHIHDYIVRSGLASNVFAGTALIDMYCKCGSVEFARYLFDNMCERNVASLNAMIAGYTQNGYANEALTLFHQMQSTNMRPGRVTVVSVLQACAHLGALQEGKEIHGLIVRKECDSDVFVRTALIDMYCKCGSIDVARHLFDTIPEKNVASWNAMISGYGMHGHGKDAIAMFSQMHQSCVMPDDITFICILSACSHAGLVDEGRQYFDCMSRDFGLKPKIEHYACMVDLLGRAGRLIEAYNFIKNMPLKPHVYVWGTLLGACRIHQNIELAKVVGKHIFYIDPDNTGYYILLSNICAASGKWDDVANIRALMEDRGLKKTPGYSLVEVNNKVHLFIAGDGSQNQSEEICIASQTD